MSDKKIDFTIKHVEPATPLTFDGEKCTGCNRCVDACPIDLLMPGSVKGSPPEAAYPDECWYCGCCVMECPSKAVRLRHPLMNRAHWVRKDTLKETPENPEKPSL